MERVPLVGINLTCIDLDFVIIMSDLFYYSVYSNLQSRDQKSDGFDGHELIRVYVDLVCVPFIIGKFASYIERVYRISKLGSIDHAVRCSTDQSQDLRQ